MIFSEILSETSFIVRGIQRDVIVSVHRFVFMSGACFSCHILMKLEFSGQILEKNIPISNFMKNHPMSADLFNADGRTDRHDEGNSLLSQLPESA